MIDHNAQGWRLNTWKEVKEVIVEAMQKGNWLKHKRKLPSVTWNNKYLMD